MLSIRQVILSLIISLILCKKKVEDLFDGLYTKDIYAGYLETGNPNHKLFYVFTPSQSDTPEKDPIILWLHGGPGCSALESFLIEIGPVVTDKFSGSFHVNEFAWNKKANVIYMESPAGVGFTINNDETKNYNEEISSTEAVYAFGEFLNEYPELKNNDFYISGFSYSGINIPFFVKALDQQSKYTVNLKGLFIGNGITTFESDNERCMVQFGYGRGLIGEELMRAFEDNCPHLDFQYRGKEDKDSIANDFRPRDVTKRCNEIRQEVVNAFKGIEIYGIYKKCRMSNNENNINEETMIYKIYDKLRTEKLRALGINDENEKEISIWPAGCGSDPFMSDFVNKETTKEKLGVDKEKTWIYCNMNIYTQYQMTESYSLYQEYLFKHKDMKIWHFSGDADMCIPTIGTMYWMNKLGLNVKTEWRQWHIKNQVAGYLQEYENNLALITFIGAGHMVPSEKREESFNALYSMINGELPK